MTGMKVNQLVIQKPENMAGISITFEHGGRVVIEAHDPMISALQPTPVTPQKANEIPNNASNTDIRSTTEHSIG